MDDEQAVQADPQTMFQRWRDRLFPYRFPEHRAKFIKRGSGHGFTTETNIFLDWPDRFRVLIGGIIHVETASNTEHDPGKSESMPFISINPPRSGRGV